MKTAGRIALLFLLLLIHLAAAPALLMAQPDFQALDINPKWNGSSFDPGLLRFCDSNDWPASTDCVSVSAALNSTAYGVRLPVDEGLAGQALVTDGLNPANLSWAANSPGGCPAGADADLQYNDSGNCGSSSGNTKYFLQKTGGALLQVFTELDAAFATARLRGSVHTGSNASGGFAIEAFQSRGTSPRPTASQNLDILMDFAGYGHTGAAYDRTALVRFSALGSYTPSSTPSQIDYYTTNFGSTSEGQRWSISPPGHWLPAGDGARNIATDATRVGAGYSDTWNSERLDFTNPAHTAKMSVEFTAGGILEFQQTDNTPAWRIDNTDNEITTFGVSRPETDGTGKIGKQDSFEYKEAHVKTYVADDAFVAQASEGSEFQTCGSSQKCMQLDRG